MSNRIEVSAVEAQFEELAERYDVQVEDLTLTIEDGPMTTSIAGSELVTEGDDESGSATEGGDEQTPTESEDTLEEGEVACQCGAVFDSKQSLYGHSSHCDEYESQSPTETEDEKDTTEGGDGQHPTDAELVEMGVKESNIEDVRKYRSKNGVCSEEDCPYGANDGSDYCASHQSKTDGNDSNESKSTTSKSYEDLTEGQKAAARDLIDDEDYSLEEAVNMV